MATLITPHARFRESWLAAAEEFGGEHMDGSGVYGGNPLKRIRTEIAADFPGFVDGLVAERLPETPRPPEFVPCTYLWLAEEDEFLGSLAIRHTLNDFLFEQGGHIGYSVRPSARRQGHAVRALHDALPVARGLGIERVLVTCAEDNTGSRTIIEKNGGVYEDSREGARRYWIELP
ncbi:GNAT family N-acetyltransferase [Arthrobacter zhangbolii]|uniref:GNAT family N-acetyltransferase n=1 Tax=Arthrobacter zhangbolii TaxID=2886936 RepID=A0A9X1M653_9MICC|nr:MULTISPECIES: GNAT family N-acetyltransferase [Arthrobacter]MCC3272139.1 GNAT family N-acetyltransferase [Arthrobacter zhangbolii]MCC3294386.1 GNAT family N-acetyltransferase [Arthrobacter zhangbolii]MDN3903192.1 GNAT family N-acetyltransferase [Arthrobacter sp. YD2]UON91987.1 GNAT family N-acetyltransferase [Arthrobacter zhangbolii]